MRPFNISMSVSQALITEFFKQYFRSIPFSAMECTIENVISPVNLDRAKI